MSDRPLVSAVVPAHNHARFVVEALRSLASQTYDSLELIVVDDASEDDTVGAIERILPDLRQRFARVEIVRAAAAGGSANVARALAFAASDYVYLLDSDDVAHPEAIERLLPLLGSEDVALAVGDNAYIDEIGRPCGQLRRGRECATLMELHTADRTGFNVERDFGSYESLIRGNYVPNGWLVRRSAIDAVGGYESSFVLDDWPVLLRLAKEFRLAFAGEVLASYRVHAGNTSQRYAERLVEDTVRILLAERQWCEEHRLHQAWWEHFRLVLGSLNSGQLDRSDLLSLIENHRRAEYRSDVKVLLTSLSRLTQSRRTVDENRGDELTVRVRQAPPEGARGQRIHLYALCWNDVRLLPHFFRHYDQVVQQYFIYDDGSDDGSLAVLAAHPRVDVRRFERTDDRSFVRSEQSFYEHCWKASRGTADWVFVVDIDEFLHHRDLGAFLAQCQRDLVTAVPAAGFEMVSASFPDENEPLLETHRRGVPSLDMSKLSIWAPDAISALRPDPGGHAARPARAILPPRDEVLLLHYKHLGAQYLIDRHRALALRLGPDDLAEGWGHQWMASDDALRATLAHYDESAIDVLAAGEVDYPNPLWWTGKYPRVQNSGRLLELEAEIDRRVLAQAALAEEHGLMKRDLEALRMESAARAAHLAAAETALRAAEHEKALLKDALEASAKRIADLENSRTWRWTSGLRRMVSAAVHEPGTVTHGDTAPPGEPDLTWPSPLALLNDLATYGAVGRYIWHSRQITGWTRGAEAAAVAEASLRLADSPLIVEVGCFLGCATTLLAGPRRIRRSGIVHCVDPFDCSGDSFSVPIYRSIASELGTSLRAAFDKNIRRAGVSDLIVVHHTTSSLAAAHWTDRIDLLYLDGDISREGSRETYLAWAKWLRPGGTLILSSTQTREPGHDGPSHVAAEFLRAPSYHNIREVEGITLAEKS